MDLTVNMIKPEFREYKESDYEQCEVLVSNAWAFDENFKPQALASLAKCIYTRGSESTSNYRRVVEVNENVAGFIFGLNEHEARPEGILMFGLSILWRLLCIRHMTYKDKKKLVNAINSHEINRSKVIKRGRSEIVLFVVGAGYQGRGYGKQLLSDFISHCERSGVNSIIVETNMPGASGFYEKRGFRHLANFESPLHEYATRGG